MTSLGQTSPADTGLGLSHNEPCYRAVRGLRDRSVASASINAEWRCRRGFSLCELVDVCVKTMVTSSGLQIREEVPLSLEFRVQPTFSWLRSVPATILQAPQQQAKPITSTGGSPATVTVYQSPSRVGDKGDTREASWPGDERGEEKSKT